MPDDDDRVRRTPQADLELEPRASGDGGSRRVETTGIAPAELFRQALEQTRMAISITDPHQHDNPLIYVNRAFAELTGYDREESIGRNCRFLQGPDTDPDAVRRIAEGLHAENVRVIEILNYRKDGSRFWNALHVGPIHDEAGRLTHYYGSQWDISETVEKRRKLQLQADVAAELLHRTRNLFTVIGSILRITARDETDVDRLVRTVSARIGALGKAHEISVSEGRVRGEGSDLHDLVSTILRPYRAEDGRRVALDGETVRVPRDAATPLGLFFHELATNAVKYGAFSQPDGAVRVAWRRGADGWLTLEWCETGGPPTAAPDRTGTGTRIIDGVLRTAGASVDYDWREAGLLATLRLPLGAEG